MKITATTKDAQQLFNQGIVALSNASITGMKVDVPYCEKQKKYLDKKTEVLKKKFLSTETGKIWKKKYLSPNINSDQQLREILFNKLKLPVYNMTEPSKTFPNGQPSVDNESLDIFSKEVPDLKYYSEYKKLDKVNNTYITGILKEQVHGFLHPFFHLNIARSFRSSSSNLNFQNQPNRDKVQKKIVRTAFIPRTGNALGTIDFKGIEVGISACNHLDPKMIKYVSDPRTDMHGDMAIQCFLLDEFDKKNKGENTLRKGAKNGFVFPQFYGDYYGNNAPVLCAWAGLPIKGDFEEKTGVKLASGVYLSDHLIEKDIRSFDDYTEHIRNVEAHFWNKRFKVYNQWKKDNVERYNKLGYSKTLTGFTFQGIMFKNAINNYPIQGAAFHCLLKVFIRVDEILRKRKFKSKLIGQIHDELVFDMYPPEIPDLLSICREVACIWLPKTWSWIIVPLEIEAKIFEPDQSWASEAKEIKLAA